MARFCYGQITHEGSVNNPIKFPSTKDREVFQAEFEAYHAQYKHDGEAPTFETIKRAEIRKEDWDIPTRDEVTIDGYKPHEIWAYHDRDDDRWVHYRPPTTCVHPIIAISNTELFESGELQRHELSGIFGDMPEDDYQSLLESIQKDGFIDPVIRLLGSEVLDGWHRYRAGKELNLLRRLQFRQWYEAEHRDGDPRTFVLARNIERRHLTPGQRAQIAVAFNERFVHGGDRGKLQNCNLKTQEQLAKQMKVSKRTISIAVKVEKAGQSESVISGEKTAGDVLKEQALEHLEAAEKKMWKAFETANLGDYITRDAFLRGACIAHKEDWDVDEVPAPEDMSTPQFWEARFEKIARDIEAEADWIQALIGKDFNSETDPQTQYFKVRCDLEALVKEKGCGLLAFHTAAKAEYARKDSSIFDLPGDIRRRNHSDSDFNAWTADILKMQEDVEGNVDWFAELISEPDYEQIQAEHVKRFAALPGDIRETLPAWKREHGIEVNVTLNVLVNARSQLAHGRERGPDPFFREEMEDVLARMKSDDADFVAKVRELLDDDTDTDENLPLQEALNEMKTSEPVSDQGEPPEITIEVSVTSHRGQIPVSLVETFTVPNPLSHNVFHTGDPEGIAGNGEAKAGVIGRIESFITEALRDQDMGVEVEEHLLKHWETYHPLDKTDDNPSS